MRRSTALLMVLLCVLLGSVSLASAIDYTITQLTDNDSTDFDPLINKNGQVVWHGTGLEGDADRDIFFYDGAVVTQVSVNAYWDGYPAVSDTGQVVWYGYIEEENPEIYKYDGATVSRITFNTYQDRYPQINASQQMTWQGEVNHEDYEIFFFNGAFTMQLTDNELVDEYPKLSENGMIVWEADDGTDKEIFYYDGSTVTQLTDNSYEDRHPQINESGTAVWEGYDGSDWEIFLYDGSSVIQLTDNSFDDQHPQINGSGTVVWDGNDGSDTEIFLYNGTTTIRITDNACLDEKPQVGASGLVAWQGYDGSDTEIFLYDGSTISQLTNNDYSDFEPFGIDESDRVVWYAHDGTDSEVFIASPGVAAFGAAFSASPLNGDVLQPVSFWDQSTGSPVSWLWDFGDGATSTDRHPAHPYTETGTYTVSLSVEDAQGVSDSVTKMGYITISPGQASDQCSEILTFDDITANNGAAVMSEEYAAQGVHFIAHPTLPVVLQDGHVYDNEHAPFGSALSGEQFVVVNTENGHGLITQFDHPVDCASFNILVENQSPVVLNAFFFEGEPGSLAERGSTIYLHTGAAAGWVNFDASVATGPFNYLLLVSLTGASWALDDLAFSPVKGTPRLTGTGIQITGFSSNVTDLVQVGDTVHLEVNAIFEIGETIQYQFFTRAGYGLPDWGGNTWTIVQDWSADNAADIIFHTAGIYFVVVHCERAGESWEFGDPQTGFAVEVGASQ